MTIHPHKGSHRRIAAWVAMLALGLLWLALWSGGAEAQTINAQNPTATFGENKTNSAAQATVVIGGIGTAGGGGGSSTQTLRTAPDVVAPSIVGGNPCMVGASIGGSVVGFGFGAGIGIEDADCETRQVSALMTNMGDRAMGFMHLCMQNDDARATILAAGHASCFAYARTISGQVVQPSVPGAPAAAPQTVAAPATAPACPPAALTALRRSGASWSEYSPACRAAHLQNLAG